MREYDPVVGGSPQILSCAEAAAIAGLDQRTFAAALERGDAPGVRVGRRWRVPRRLLDLYLAGLDWRAAARGA